MPPFDVAFYREFLGIATEDVDVVRAAWVAAAATVVTCATERAEAQLPDERMRVYVPSLARGAVVYRDVPTAALTNTPTASPTATATGTPDAVGTIVAATLTAGAPTPSDTPDAVATSVAATMTALVPTVTGTPTPTRTPTPTATASPVCAEQFKNGGFEDGLEYWDTVGGRIDAIGQRAGDPVFEGLKFAEIWPREDGQLIALRTGIVKVPPAESIASATIRYQLRGRSLERLPHTDHLSIAIRDPNVLRCIDCERELDFLFNDDVYREWRSRVFDVTEQLRGGWPEVRLTFYAKNDVSDPTWWHVDAVSFVICTR